MNKQLLISLFIFIFVIMATITVIMIGKGYRFGFNTGKLEIAGTGLLVLKSSPDSAQVFIDDHLTTATNNTINLIPGHYKVKIFKDGYFPWEKQIIVQAETVSRADALLFPVAPKLESVSNNGATNPTIDPSQSRIAFTVSSQSAKKNGIYVLDTSARPILTLQNSSTQIADDTVNTFSQAKIQWSPDGKELLASISGQFSTPTVYLLDTTKLNDAPSDVTETLPIVLASWKKLQDQIDKSRLDSIPKDLQKITKEDFSILSWSPDETKILYMASDSANIPLIIKPRLIGVDSTAEERNITKGNVYVYDIKEDRNYLLPLENFASSYTWLPDSSHIVFSKDGKISIMEYDGQNPTIIYAGPFITKYLFPWSDETRIAILTDLGNTSVAPNLYTISLK